MNREDGKLSEVRPKRSCCSSRWVSVAWTDLGAGKYSKLRDEAKAIWQQPQRCEEPEHFKASSSIVLLNHCHCQGPAVHNLSL